jgi:tetratricopeptide (TPR) repeat protein
LLIRFWCLKPNAPSRQRLTERPPQIELRPGALAAAPGSIDAWYARGMTLVTTNRPQQAIKSLDYVIAAELGFSQVQLLRSKLLMDLGRHDAALEALDQFTAKFPICAEAWFGRSHVLFSALRAATRL